MNDPEWKSWLRDMAYADETDDDPVYVGHARQALERVAELEAFRANADFNAHAQAETIERLTKQKEALERIDELEAFRENANFNARAQAETIKRLRSAWEAVRTEVDKTMGWRRTRASGAMVTATDTSEFASLPPSALKVLDRMARRALKGGDER